MKLLLLSIVLVGCFISDGSARRRGRRTGHRRSLDSASSSDESSDDDGGAYMPNSQFTGWGHRELNFEEYVSQNAPIMMPWCQKIKSIAKLYTVSPFIALQLMDEEDLHDFDHVNSTLHYLAGQYYAHYNNRDEDQQMAATKAITDHFNGDEHECAEFINRFHGRCPTVSMEREPVVDRDELDAHMAHQMKLLQVSDIWEFPLCPVWGGTPDPECDGYRFGGVHTWAPGVWSGLDFYSPTICCGWNQDLSSELVFTSWGGTVDIIDPCGFVEVDHGVWFTLFNVSVTWQTRYLHLDGPSLSVTDGQNLPSGDSQIGLLAETQAGATCVPGTFSTGPHLHWDFMVNGQYANLRGMTFSGYRVDYPTNPTPYDPDTFMTKDGATFNTHSDLIYAKHCFHVDTLVQLASGKYVTMADLKQGDRVLAVDDSGAPIYSEVMAFATRELDLETVFVEIMGENGDLLRLTPNHFVYKSNGAAVQAQEITAGDQLRTAAEEPFVVNQVALVKDQGVVAPLTESGTIATSRVHVVASNYAHLGSLASTPEALHLLSSPVRYIASISPFAAQSMASAFFKVHEALATVREVLLSAGVTASA